MAIGFIELAALLLLVLGLALLIRRVLVRTHEAGDQLPRCGRCGYVVRGIATFSCPECGCDLREVGIRVPGEYPMSSRLVNVVVWTVLICLIGGVSTALITNFVPQPMRSTSEIEFMFDDHNRLRIATVEPTQWSTNTHYSAQGSYHSGGTTVQWSNSQPAVSMTLNFSGLSTVTPMPLFLDAGRGGDYYSRSNAGGRVHVSWPPTEAQLDQWLTAQGMRLAPQQASQLRGFAMLCRDLALGAPALQLTVFDYAYFSSQTQPAWAIGLETVLVLLWFAVWVVGLVKIVRRGSRASHAASSPSPSIS